MNLVDLSRSLLILPANYDDVRPHHLVLGYSLWKIVASTSILHKASQKILSFLSNFAETCIPLIYSGLIPDFVVRFGIRIQLRDHLNLLASETAEAELSKKMSIVQTLKEMPIAIETDKANVSEFNIADSVWL